MSQKSSPLLTGVMSIALLASGTRSHAQAEADNAAELAKHLANPIASLISLPIQCNFDWENEQLTLPLNLMVAQLVKIGGAPVQFQLGGRYYADGPDNAPEWGLRFAVTLLWPK